MTIRMPTRRDFLALAATTVLLAGCSGDGDAGTSGEAPVPARTVTTPLGAVEVPAEPRRVVAIDSRQDLEIALALGLPVVGYTSRMVQPWVPLGGGARRLESPVDVEEIRELGPDLILATSIEDEYWLAPGLVDVAPVLPIDPAAPWPENLRAVSGWLGAEQAARAALDRYEDRLERVRERHGTAAMTEPVAVVDLRAPGQVGDLSHPPGVPSTVLADLDVPVLRFTPSADEQLGREAGELLARAGRLLVVTNEPGLDAASLAGDEVFGTVPAVRDGRLVVTGDVAYGSVYTALEILVQMDRLLGL
ncbi:ABC transporter substrate-binding protein [Hoyosella sp. G463]|uniref:ABC transporter substrate-binding protein n=1 Tax=Lolliginicoccus lacisalsi TaxID=2742202 RepID=A0A927JC37_9ACTN|nr:ABC transporter substrate-binding protein [Lolliginicoccus lacisalsi]MBD8506574.1 ABC transporter substrate-binding protein [Lolliginicoccus lacisalsi]